MIYHIAVKSEWDAQASSPTYAPARYASEGFIHCSEMHQLEPVANRHFNGSTNLLVLELMPTKLDAETKYEQGGEERYPHIYGPINKSAIVRTIRVKSRPDGTFAGSFAGI